MWAPRPRALPPRLAFPPLRKGPGVSPRGHGPSAGQGALRGGARVCGRGSRSAPAPAALRRERGGGRGRAPRCSYCAPPRSPQSPPQKNATAAAKPIAVCITSCLLLFLPAPAHPPAAGTGVQCVLLGWKRPSSCMGDSGRERRSLPSPRGLWGKSSCPSRPLEERRWGGKAGRGARTPSRLNDEDVVWPPAGEGGRGNGDALQQWVAAGREGRLLRRRAVSLPPRRPGDARRNASHHLPAAAGPASAAHKREQEEGLGFSRPFFVSYESSETVADWRLFAFWQSGCSSTLSLHLPFP